MLTIFSCPKPFRGHIEIIQGNAIRSWSHFHPMPEIILFGDEEGTAEICKEFGLRHIPEVERNEYGTPLVSSIFNKAQVLSSHKMVCYVNTDIIFLNDLSQTVTKLDQYAQGQRVLLSGRRWNIKMEKYWDYNIPNWELELKKYVLSNGEMDSYGSIDYFVFPRGCLTDIPAFALGRYRWDKWLLYKCRSLGMLLIDASSEIIAIHQIHDYSHTLFKPKNKDAVISPEVQENLTLGHNAKYYTLLDASHLLTANGVNKQSFSHKVHRCLLRIYLFTYPISYPLMLWLKLIRLFSKRVRMYWRKPC